MYNKFKYIMSSLTKVSNPNYFEANIFHHHLVVFNLFPLPPSTLGKSFFRDMSTIRFAHYWSFYTVSSIEKMAISSNGDPSSFCKTTLINESMQVIAWVATS